MVSLVKDFHQKEHRKNEDGDDESDEANLLSIFNVYFEFLMRNEESMLLVVTDE